MQRLPLPSNFNETWSPSRMFTGWIYIKILEKNFQQLNKSWFWQKDHWFFQFFGKIFDFSLWRETVGESEKKHAIWRACNGQNLNLDLNMTVTFLFLVISDAQSVHKIGGENFFFKLTDSSVYFLLHLSHSKEARWTSS